MLGIFCIQSVTLKLQAIVSETKRDMKFLFRTFIIQLYHIMLP